jgi:hypothetical protein
VACSTGRPFSCSVCCIVLRLCVCVCVCVLPEGEGQESGGVVSERVVREEMSEPSACR